MPNISSRSHLSYVSFPLKCVNWLIFFLSLHHFFPILLSQSLHHLPPILLSISFSFDLLMSIILWMMSCHYLFTFSLKKIYAIKWNFVASRSMTKWSVVNISMLTLYLPVLRGCKILFGSLTAISNILLLINAPLAMEFHLKCTKNSALIFYSK